MWGFRICLGKPIHARWRVESGNHSPVGLVMARGPSSKVGLLDIDGFFKA